MSPPKEAPPTGRVAAWFHGLGEVVAFFWAGARAVVSVLLGRWPTPAGRTAARPKPPTEGAGLIKRIAPYPTDD